MHTFGSAFYELKGALSNLYDEREAAAIAHYALEHVTGRGKLDRLVEKDRQFTDPQEEDFLCIARQLIAGVPLQYATGEAWFMGERYLVNENVLIPRPETEELVQWVVNECEKLTALSILDIGTGSGCIPISLARALKQARITSCDISPGAIEVARQNAESLGVNVEFVVADFLDGEARSWLGEHDVIVSNPPYIPQAQEQRLHVNVREHEPALALFVPDSDPLVFYRAIAEFGSRHLRPGGAVYCELDADHAEETAQMFRRAGYEKTELRRDFHENLRMLCARF